jgi:Protein O-mannosyl-transferase TMEM260-like
MSEVAPLLLFAGTLAFYVVHLCPTTTWGDTAGLHHAVDRPLSVGARGYPLFILLERLVRGFPTDDFFYNANLLTAFLGALTVVTLYAAILKLTTSPFAAACGAVSFGVAHTVWTYAVITEVYTLNHLVMAAMLWLLLEFRDGKRWALPLLLLIAGLGTGHHRLLGFMAVPVLLFVGIYWRRLTPGIVIASLLTFVMGAAPLIVLLDRALTEGMPPGKLAWFYLTGDISKSLFNADPGDFVKSAGLYGAYLAFNFVGPAILLAVAGFVSLFRLDRVVLAVLAIVFLMYSIFSIGYRHHGIWVAYNTHSFLPVAVLVGLGAAAWRRRFSGAAAPTVAVLLLATAIVPFATYRLLPSILDRLEARPFNVVDSARFHRWYLDPSKQGDTSAPDTARAIFAAVPDDAIVLGDWGVIALLRLIRDHDGLSDSIRLDLYGGQRLDRRLDRLGPSRPIYLVHFPYYAPHLSAQRYGLVPLGGDLPLLRIEPLRGGR